MPSRKSPSQRAQAMRLISAFMPGSHGGRVASAALAPTAVPSVPSPVESSGGSDNHAGEGVASTAVGGLYGIGPYGAPVASGEQSTAIGSDAYANSFSSTAVGQAAQSVAGEQTLIGCGTYGAASALRCVVAGVYANAYGADSISIGHSAQTGIASARSMAIGAGAVSTIADQAVMRFNEVEVVRSNGSGATTMILADTAGTRWRIGVDTSGNPIGMGAA